MTFAIDKQTTDELNLFGKFRTGSIYNMFNKTKTRGGEKLLDTMFMTPLLNEQAINERTIVLKYFDTQKMVFPFDPNQVALLREYVDTGAGRSLLIGSFSTVINRVLSSLTRDERYKKEVLGLHATIAVLKSCYTFLENLTNAPAPFDKSVKAVKQILADKNLVRLSEMDIYKTLSIQSLIFYNHLLKTRMYTQIEDVLNFIYELDVYIAVSEVGRSRGFIYPEAFPAKDNVLAFENLYHPSLEKAIGNLLTLNERSNVMFLTGANMAGKSTLMKAIGIGVYLAHLGFPIAASKMRFSVRDGLYSSINVADNIDLGYSHFYAEVVRVKQAALAAASGKRLLLMFDELFKGTNVKDAYDGTLAVTEGFSDYSKCLFIVSTHIIEVGQALKQHKNIQFNYMPTVMEGVKPRYTYKMEKGITKDRQGMMIIRNEGILELIGA